MYRKQVNQRSPMRILESSTHGGLGPGNLGVIMARAGVGKTAFLVQVGLDDAMRHRSVLHVALGFTVDHVQSWWDALFDDLASVVNLDDRDGVQSEVAKHRVIQAVPEANFRPEDLDRIIGLYKESTRFDPKAILIDGYDWEGGDPETRKKQLAGFKDIAKKLEAELWMSAQTHRRMMTPHPTSLIAPCDSHDDLIDLALYLEPEKRMMSVRLLKDHGEKFSAETSLELHADTMRLASEETKIRQVKLPASSFTMVSGGTAGAEAAFGQAAEQWGLSEVTYSFKGHETERTRGLVELDASELERGSVSKKYVETHLHRSFPDTEDFQKILSTIWHQVSSSSELFVIGEIQDDGTVHGGTGWGPELARHLGKRIHVFDQGKDTWFAWKDESWKKVEPPRIRYSRFAATGTRSLTEEGKKAIEGLFKTSFGDAPNA